LQYINPSQFIGRKYYSEDQIREEIQQKADEESDTAQPPEREGKDRTKPGNASALASPVEFSNENGHETGQENKPVPPPKRKGRGRAKPGKSSAVESPIEGFDEDERMIPWLGADATPDPLEQGDSL
jgi:hypothetical protein